jgi:tRNA 2-selenouridine synthase
VSHRQPIRVTDRHQFDTLIDARSPAEFEQDHIPGAINCPVLDNEERARIGTIYKQARHLQDTFADKPAHWKPLVYCWRGGLRSGSMVTWLRLVGWDAQQLANGYKSYRGHVIELVDHLVPQLRLQVLCGATGSAKTRVLHALAEAGEQVLDLEGYARHKGSLLGNLPGVEQPSQKYFETLLAQQLERFDLSRPVYVEGESVKIGRISLPLVLVEHMRQSSVIEIDATPQARLDYLLRDYAYLGDDPQALADKLAWLKELQGREAVSRWQAWAHERSLSPLFSELMAQHYDPHYQRSQERHFTQWRTRRTVQTADLSEAGIAELARQILVLDAASAV